MKAGRAILDINKANLDNQLPVWAKNITVNESRRPNNHKHPKYQVAELKYI